MKPSSARIKFGKRVRELRQKSGLTQEELGFRAKLHRTYIGSIERGEQNVAIENIFKLAKALQITLSELFQSI